MYFAYTGLEQKWYFIVSSSTLEFVFIDQATLIRMVEEISRHNVALLKTWGSSFSHLGRHYLEISGTPSNEHHRNLRQHGHTDSVEILRIRKVMICCNSQSFTLAIRYHCIPILNWSVIINHWTNESSNLCLLDLRLKIWLTIMWLYWDLYS